MEVLAPFEPYAAHPIPEEHRDLALASNPTTATLLTLGDFPNGDFSEFIQGAGFEKEPITFQKDTDGHFFARFTANDNVRMYGDNANVRIHIYGFNGGNPSWFGNGNENWRGISIRVPSGCTVRREFVTDEVHGDNGSGPAPLNLAKNPGVSQRLQIRGSLYGTTGGAFPFSQDTFGVPSSGAYDGEYYRHQHDWVGGNHPDTLDEWLHFRMGWFWSLDSTKGWFHAYARWGSMSEWREIVPKFGPIINTYKDFTGDGQAIYPMMSLYYPVGTGGTSMVDYKAGVWAGGATSYEECSTWQDKRLGFDSPVVIPPTPTTTPTTATSSIKDGDHLTGTVVWEVDVTGPGDTVEFFLDNSSIGKVPVTDNKAVTTLDPAAHPNVTNGGFRILNAGAIVYASPSIAFTLAPTPTVIHDLKSVGLTYNASLATYYLSGVKTDGTKITGTYKDRTTALSALDKQAARLLP